MRKRLLTTIRPKNTHTVYYPKGTIFEVSTYMGVRGVYFLCTNLKIDNDVPGLPNAGWGYSDLKTKELIIFDELIDGVNYESL